ncbi:uncharacterized protein LOC107791111 [Nicotiana tabacum]|uniref:Uncharacterized protein LOC107791111 n=2 Tax=Nicotiana TaxID=4085 RepID=A0A1S3ZW91_TOBAC|nr:PREDICTED: uncharacterized protein LOC104226456 [Nicotiana sylvestris]XP_016468594.1 PREDICTED: uncharacterized protein LOC107791111 [Nicotiana tabacum]
MEQNLPVIAKKFWKIVRAAFFMLRKGISKQKLMLDIKLMVKRSKIGSCKSAVQNLMFHHTHHLSLNKRNKHTTTLSNENDVVLVDEAVVKVLEMIQCTETAYSPANNLPGFGRTPIVRKLRVTDSPFPLRSEEDNYNHVDEAADEFISKFYRNLRRQSSLSAS